MRAFRPSYFTVADDECDEEIERAKAVNMEMYAERVQARLPLFEIGLLDRYEPDSRAHRVKA